MERKDNQECPLVPVIFQIQTVVMHDFFTATILIKTSSGAAMGELAHGWAFSIPTVESFDPYPNTT